MIETTSAPSPSVSAADRERFADALARWLAASWKRRQAQDNEIPRVAGPGGSRRTR